MKRIIKKLPFVHKIFHSLNNQHERDHFVCEQLQALPKGSSVLDAGCGSQRYREHCEHLSYKAQDFGKYTVDDKKIMGVMDATEYRYGKLDYVGNIWEISENNDTFDAILCTEVLEHIPYPTETIKEFSRLLKPNGTLILTAPSNCLRHMDPYFFYSGFSDRWFQRLLTEHGLKIERIDAVGDYYSWLKVELARTAWAHSIFAKLALMPAFLYFLFKKKTQVSVDTLCMGYHVVARKVINYPQAQDQ